MLTHFTLRPELNGCHYACGIFNWIFWMEFICILIEMSQIFPHRFNWYYVTIGSGTHLAPYWWQAIGWSSDDKNFAAIRSLGLNELKYMWAWDKRRRSWYQEWFKIPHAVGTQGICGSAWVSLDKGVYHTDVNINCHAKKPYEICWHK